MTPLLSVEISVHYRHKTILRDVRFEMAEGEALGVAGQSGSGKSTLGLAIMGLLDWKGGTVTGSVRFRSRELVGEKERALRSVRGKEIALVMQSSNSALNPALRLETQLREAWRAHSNVPWWDHRPQALALLSRFDLPASDDFLRRFPSQISVGQAQRVLIAMALLHRPALLIADEPTSALDPATAVEVIETLRIANREWNTALIYISHDVASLSRLCDRVAVMFDGSVVEQGLCQETLDNPKHWYTRRLLQAVSAAGPKAVA